MIKFVSKVWPCSPAGVEASLRLKNAPKAKVSDKDAP